MNQREHNEHIEDPIQPETSESINSDQHPRPQPPEFPDPSEPGEADHLELDQSEKEPAPIGEETTNPDGAPTLDRKKVLLLGGGLGAAVLFFALTMMIGHGSHQKAKITDSGTAQPQAKAPTQSQGTVAPVMDALRKVDPEANDGQLTVDDIRRMRPVGSQPSGPSSNLRSSPLSSTEHPSGTTLASVPSFADTQQKWEDPRPYDQTDRHDHQQPQEQAALRETALVFVRTSAQPAAAAKTAPAGNDDEPLLEVTPGSRIMAKLQYAISTADAAPVVAQVEYTYAIGEQIIVPAGALIYGHIEQADRVGYVSVKFDEVEIDHKREKIDAIGQSLDMGPIKGKVTGTNAGKNLLVRSISGIGSTMAMVFGNNTSSAFSEDDLIRERLAENIGTAGDSQIMNLALTSKTVVTVDADTKIYVVFTKHEQSPSGLHRVNPAPM